MVVSLFKEERLLRKGTADVQSMPQIVCKRTSFYHIQRWEGRICLFLPIDLRRVEYFKSEAQPMSTRPLFELLAMKRSSELFIYIISLGSQDACAHDFV